MADEFAKTPEPPYYAVIFVSQRTEGDNGYGAMAEVIDGVVRKQPGFLGLDHARSPDGRGITVGYFRDEASILAWKQQTQHRAAQRGGMERWYSHYELRVAKVERAYAGPEGRSPESPAKGSHP
ncbi:MAG TPA: antibiotic biosynthesis monooxygenase [bacterium]